MFKNMVPVTKAKHGKIKVKASNSFEFARELHVAYITSQEFVRAATTYPIVFIEDGSNSSGFRPVVLMGLQAGKNLFVGEDGTWQASYVPAIVRRYPFALTKASDSDDYLVCIDEGSDLVNKKDGAALFDSKGEPTEVVENVKRYLSELQQLDQLTNQFCDAMAGQNLFTPLNMRVGDGAALRNITGCYIVNEQRLNGLSGERFAELRERGYLAQIYAHLISLGQMERLVKMNAAQQPASASSDEAATPEASAEVVH